MGRVEVCVKEVGAVVGVLQEVCAIWRNKIFWSFGTCRETNEKTIGPYYILPTHSRDSIKVWAYQIRPTVCTRQPSVTHNKLATLIRIK